MVIVAELETYSMFALLEPVFEDRQISLATKVLTSIIMPFAQDMNF